jgi:outer membrane immunogenic protein
MLGGATGFALALAATSADARNVAAPFSWTGFYLGGHAGYSWAEVSSEFAFPGDPYPTTKNNGLIGGVHVGYQRQVGQLVLGAEAGVTQLQNSENGVPYPLAPVSSVESRLEDLGYIGAKIGWSSGKWLPYIAGGYAVVDVSKRQFASGTGATQLTSSERQDGWYLGAGVDWALSPNWILGVDYRHYDFQKTMHFPVSTTGVPDIPVHTQATIDAVTLRLDYKFASGW